MKLDAKAINELRAIYRQAQREIIDTLNHYQVWNVDGYELGRVRVILKQVEEILKGLEDPTMDWVEGWLPKAYSEGTLYATKSLKALGADTGALKAGFSVVDQEAVQALAEYSLMELQAANAGILSKVGVIIRQASQPAAVDAAVARGLASDLVLGRGIPEMKANLLKGALNGQFAPGGYKGSLEDYAELLARTRTREAQMGGAISRYTEAGQDLVIVPPHPGACNLCAPLQGMVFSISGSSKIYPALADVGAPPWHPNCIDVIAPFVIDLASDEEISRANAATAEGLRSMAKKAA